MLWAGTGCPKPNLPHLLSHKPKIEGCGWERIFERVCKHEDDGHMIKLIRALKNAETVSKPYENEEIFRFKQDMFLVAANAAVDSGSEKPMEYIKHFNLIRMAGLPEAWVDSNVAIRALG